MPPTKTWKAVERKIASFFGTLRTPLSGGNSGHTRSDSRHPVLFVEAKHRTKHTAVTLWDSVKKLAIKENKIPVVCLNEKGRPGFWIMVHSDDLEAVAAERRIARHENEQRDLEGAGTEIGEAQANGHGSRGEESIGSAYQAGKVGHSPAGGRQEPDYIQEI